jgi:hypothetical protein
MRRSGLIAAVLIPGALLVWLITPAHQASTPVGVMPRAADDLVLTGDEGWDERKQMLRRAVFRHQAAPYRWPRLDTCHFLAEDPSGTTPKFNCVFEGGEVLKVKYGRNPEPHAEVAATRLLQKLGYGADDVVFIPRLRCFGCARLPFLAMRVAERARAVGLTREDSGDGFTDFEWVAIEHRFDAPAVETGSLEGWAWWELSTSEQPRAEVDAFALLAVFLSHWDNKSNNQRLVCLDGLDRSCRRSLAMMQDLGATFGPAKVNLARWRDTPIWADRARCVVSMRDMPFQGATFQDRQISEEGRAQLARALSMLADDEIRGIFRDARFPDYYSPTDDDRDLDAWTSAFKARVAQIAGVTCPLGQPVAGSW